MKAGIVVDTSVFIEYLRGTADDTLAILVLENQVMLSPVVRLELLAGARKADVAVVERVCETLRPIATFATPEECEKLLKAARGTGLLGGIPDLLVIADAVRHNAALFTYDNKMARLARRLDCPLLQT